MLLNIENLVVSYGAIQALQGVSLSIARGEMVALIGGNGAGKTTLLRTISGLLRPISGTIQFDPGKNGSTADSESVAQLQSLPPHEIVRRGISHAPEGRQVFSNLTVYENLQLGAYQSTNRKQIGDDLTHCFNLFPILLERQHQKAGTLSGGEQQMLAIARALVGNPSVILMDEPSEGLAPVIVEELARAIKRLASAEGLTLVVVEQNTRLALDISPRTVVLDRGRVVYDGASDVLRADPAKLEQLIGVGKR